jgi:holo-[acyl-carrier protein] synthase
MVLGLGIDIIEIARVEAALTRYGRLRERLFTSAEVAYCSGKGRPGASLAARFAAKEAVKKACSAQMPGVVLPWREIEVSMAQGRPEIALLGKTGQLAARSGIQELLVSLTHSREYACAVVLVLGDGTQDLV